MVTLPPTRYLGVTSSPVLIGRTAECAVLSAAVQRLRAGEGSTLAVQGVAGLGKSRLVREAVAEAGAAGVPVLAGRAVPGAAAVAYRAVSEAVMTWTRNHPVPNGAGFAPYRRALGALTGDLDDGERGPVSPVFVAEALLRLTLEIGDGSGTLLVVDDLHWADEETLAVVEYLADHAAAARLLLLVTTREEEGPASRRLLRALAARGSAVVLEPAPLDAAATGALAQACLDAPVVPALAGLLTERADGIPLLVEELLSALDSAGALVPTPVGVDVRPGSESILPASVADAVLTRLRRLPDEERRVLEAAAVLGRVFDWERLAGIVQLPEADVAAALQAGAQLHLLDEDPLRPGALRFRHALLRDGVLSSALPPTRTWLTRRAVDALLDGDDTGARVVERDLPLAVELAERCGDMPLAARLALVAAVRSFDRWELGAAERWIAQARRLAGVDDELVVEIDVHHLRVAASVGRPDVVRRLGAALLTRAQAGDDLRLEVQLRLAQVALQEGCWKEGEAYLRSAATLLEHSQDPCARTRYELWCGVSLLHQGKPDQALDRMGRAIQAATPHDDQADLICSALLHTGRARLPDVDAARRAWAQGLELATHRGMRVWRGRLLAELAASRAAELGGGEELTEAGLIATEAGAVDLLRRVSLLHAELALACGRPADAEHHLESVPAATDAGGAPVDVVSSRAATTRALAAAMSGDAEAVLRLVPDSSEEISRIVRGVLALATDDLLAAQAHAGTGAGTPAEPLLASFDALLAVLADRPAHASGAVQRAATAASAARRTARAGDGEGAGLALTAAVAEVAAAPWFAAHLARIVTPDVLAAGGGAQVQQVLRSTLAYFEGARLHGPAQACRALLRDSGVPVPRRPAAQAGVPDQLRALGVTARELDVLRLVADGLTNREVAARLYLSPRTVDKHLERLMLKTGCPNRAALSTLLAAATTS